VDRKNYALVSSLSCSERRPGSQGIVSEDYAFANLRKVSAQRVEQERLMPIPVPGGAGGTAESLQHETEAKNGSPRESTE
jgi:hypothetical protein